MTREEIIAAITAGTERIERLRPLATAAGETPLGTGEWRVRDALSHLAARGNPVPLVQTRVARAASGTPPRPNPDINAINAGQVSERVQLSVDALLDEIVAGHKAAIQQVPALDDAFLAQMLTIGQTATELSVAEMLVRAGVGHEANHLEEIEAALRAKAT